ncbi:hypothetical protein [Thioclava sp.]
MIGIWAQSFLVAARLDRPELQSRRNHIGVQRDKNLAPSKDMVRIHLR